MKLETKYLFECVLNKDIIGVKTALSQNANVNEHCRMDIVLKNDGTEKLCKDANAEKDVNMEWQGDDRTPLIFAALTMNVEIAKLLIAAGAKVDDFDTYGMSPLHYAARPNNYSPGMMQILLDAGAYVDERDGDRYTPMDYLKLSVEKRLEKASVYFQYMERNGKKCYG